MKIVANTLCLLIASLLSLGCDPPNEIEKQDTAADTMSHDDHEHDEHDEHDDHAGHDHGDHGDHDDHGDHGDHGDHEDHDHDSLTMNGVLKDLQMQSDEIEKAFGDESPDNAHDAMHSIGHTIGDLKVAAKNEGFDADSMKEIDTASEELLDAFGALDEGLHGGEKTTFADVKSEIDAAMMSINKAIESAETSGPAMVTEE